MRFHLPPKLFLFFKYPLYKAEGASVGGNNDEIFRLEALYSLVVWPGFSLVGELVRKSSGES